MKVKLPTEDKIEEERVNGPEDDPNQDELPADETPADDTPLENENQIEEKPDSVSEADLKIARLEGKIEGMQESGSKPAPGSSQEERDQAVKQQCLADMNTMDDDAFQTKYRMTKLAANTAVHEFDFTKEKTRTAVRIAELEAKSDLLAKYPSLAKHYDKIKQTVKSELSQEAQQDPARLKRAIEREFLLTEKENPQPKKKVTEDPMRRRIVNDFERPNQDPEKAKDKPAKDELAPELAAVGKRFGITSESQRKKFMSPFIPMDLGGGYRFEDPKEGFKKVASK